MVYEYIFWTFRFEIQVYKICLKRQINKGFKRKLPEC